MSSDIDNLICTGSRELFLEYGFKNITVDDIAKRLRMSKKTFYKHFKNKNEVIKTLAQNFVFKSRLLNKAIINEKTDTVDKLLKIYKSILTLFSVCSPRLIFEIKKYYDDANKLLAEYSENEFHHTVSNLIRQGKEEGLFRNDIDEDTICKFQINRIKSIIEGEILADRPITDPIYMESIIIDLIGITTIKGHKLIVTKANEIQNEII